MLFGVLGSHTSPVMFKKNPKNLTETNVFFSKNSGDTGVGSRSWPPLPPFPDIGRPGGGAPMPAATPFPEFFETSHPYPQTISFLSDFTSVKLKHVKASARELSITRLGHRIKLYYYYYYYYVRLPSWPKMMKLPEVSLRNLSGRKGERTFRLSVIYTTK